MATVLADSPGQSKTKTDARLEQELGKVAGKIRLNDFLTGVLTLAVLTLGYGALGVLVDKLFVLDIAVRRVGLAGYVLLFVGSVYWLVLRPLFQAVNPRYAARQIEGTMDDAKNVLINWVDLQDEKLADPVRAAVGANAARGVADADVQKVGESRKLLWLGGAAGLLVMAFAAMFLVFKPAPFSSLVKRTFLPFQDIAIASRTTVSVVEPAGGDVTVTAGEPLVIKVDVSGSVPDAADPDRVRLLVRHHPEATEYETIALEPGASSSEWTVRLNQSVIQNGFWYRAAGGDSKTPEYRVTVRSKPLITEYEAKYVYPAYTRLKPETAREPSLSAFRGTQVTLTITTNRSVRRAWINVTGATDNLPGKVIGENKSQVQYEFPLTESGSYRIAFSPASDEPTETSPPYPIKVLLDQPPTPEITVAGGDPDKPLPANGLLTVDGTIGDDFGVDKVTLKMRAFVGNAPLELQPKPFNEGKSFRRVPDPTKPEVSDYPTTVTYKDSVPLADVKGVGGQPVALTAGMEIEYWLEALDNCTEPKPNLGKSKLRRIKLAEPIKSPEQIRSEQARRQAEEAGHKQQQEQKFRTEKRDTPPQPRPDQTEPPKGGEQAPMPGEAPKGGEPMNPPKGGEQQGTKTGDPMPMPTGGEKPMGGEKPPEGTPQQPPKGGEQPQQGPMDPKAGGNPEQGAKPGTDPMKVAEQAKKVEAALNEQNQQGGGARKGEDTKPDAGAKPAEPKAGAPPEKGAETPKAGDPAEKPNDPASGTKGAGNVEQPKPADAKPQPEQPGQEPTKREPVIGDAGQEKPTPKDPKTPEKDPGASRSETPKQQPGGEAPKPGEEPPAGGQKTKPETTRGAEKTAPKPDGSNDTKAADGKGDKPADPGAAKPPMAKAPEEPGSKPAPKEADPAKPNEAGGSKPSGTDPMQPKNAAGQEKPAEGAQGNDEQKNGPGEVSKAINDLGSDDPKKRQAAKDKLDQTVGKQERERYERIAEDLKSGDKDRVEKAQKELGELERENGGKSGEKSNFPPRQSDIERLNRKSEDLASDDPQKRKDAEDEFADKLQKKDQDRLKQAANDAKSNDPAKREQAKKDVDELTKKAAKNDANKKPSKEDVEQLAKKADDLASDDDAKREAAEKEFDQKVGRQNREQIQKDMQDLKSKDADTAKAAQDRIQKAAEKASQNGDMNQRPPSKEEIEQMAKKAEDLASKDDAKRQAAEKEFDEKLGKSGREELQKNVQDLKSGDPMKEKAAQERIQKAAQDMAKSDPKNEKPPSKEEIEKMAKKAEDLASKDDAKRQAAEKEFDEKFGKDAREQLQKDVQDLKSGDPMKEKAAQERIQKAAQDMAKSDPKNAKPPSKEEIEQMAKKAEDLASKDDAKRQAAEKEFDEKLGKEGREQLQKDVQDLKSGDPKKQEEAKKRLEEMAKRSGKNGGGEPSKDDVEKFQQQAQDLASDDKGKRDAAEKDLDDKIGKEKREQLQKDMQDLKSNDPKKQEEAKKRLDQMAKEFKPGPGHGSKGQDGKPHDDNPENRLKTAELQLQQFEKNKHNKELLNKLGYTEEEYERFLNGYKEMVAKQRDEVEKQALGQKPKPAGPAAQKVGEGSGGKKLDTRPDGTQTGTGSASPGTAPPGYSEAQKKFAEEAAKLRKGQDKK